jgi:hypothetical protein
MSRERLTFWRITIPFFTVSFAGRGSQIFHWTFHYCAVLAPRKRLVVRADAPKLAAVIDAGRKARTETIEAFI